MTWLSSKLDQAHCVLRELAQIWQAGLLWAQLRSELRPEHIGHWPLRVRVMVLFVCALVITALVFVGLFLFAPRISVEEHSHAKTMEEQIRAQQTDNLVTAVRQLELQRRSIFSHVLLKHNTHELSDITWAMDIVRTAASATAVQLLSLAPDFSPDLGPDFSPNKDLAVMSLQARLMLSSLSAFWLALSEAAVDFSISEISLEQAQEPGIFNMQLGLVVPITATARLSAAAPDLASQKRPKNTQPKGFLLRSGSSKILYLIRDDNGRLRGVEK